MSIRKLIVQYVGGVLFLPKLERDVMRIYERDRTGRRVREYVPIVRCRDCRWFTPTEYFEEERGYGSKEILCEPSSCGNPERCHMTYDGFMGKRVPVQVFTEPNGYCAWAERRE